MKWPSNLEHNQTYWVLGTNWMFQCFDMMRQPFSFTTHSLPCFFFSSRLCHFVFTVIIWAHSLRVIRIGRPKRIHPKEISLTNLYLSLNVGTSSTSAVTLAFYAPALLTHVFTQWKWLWEFHSFSWLWQQSYWNDSSWTMQTLNLLPNTEIPDVSYIGMLHIRIGIGDLWQTKMSIIPLELSRMRNRNTNQNSHFFGWNIKSICCIVSKTKREKKRVCSRLRPSFHCDPNACRFLIVPDFSSNQMNEYLIRSSQNTNAVVKLELIY